MYNGKRFLLTVFVVLFLASLLYPVWCQDGQGFDYVDNNTSNVDGAADIGSHSGFPAQQAGPDSTYDTLTEQNTGAGEITKIGTDTSGTGTSLTLSFSHTLVSGTARIVIVSIGVENGNTIDVSTVTYGGVTMTFAVEGITGTSSFRYLSEIWYILEADLPSEGSQTVAITFTGTASSLEVNAFCSEYTGVSQSAPEATAEHHQTTGTTITNDISPSENAWVLSVIGSGNTGSWTHGESQVEVHDFADSSSTFAVAELRGASGETSLSSTFSTTVNRLERVAASWAMAIEDNYELDLEVQWTNATFDQPNEELAIYGGTMGAENIRVDVWTGSSWNNLLNDLSTGWNNVSVTDYLTSPTFSIRFKGGIESGDSSQDTWEIDCTLLHTSGGNPPVANFSYTPESPYTSETITFNASTSFDSDGSIVNYYWDFGDQTNGTGLTTTHVYNDDGTYPVNLTVTDDQGLTDTVTKDVTVLNRVPVASFTESASTVLTGESILFNASGSSDPDGFIVSYFWDFGDGLNGSGVTVSHSYVDDGGFTVTLTVTDDDGAVDSVSALKTVLNRVPVASFTESATTAYVGEPISFNASASYDPDGYIVSYFWDFDDGFNATGVVVNHSYLSNGSFTVTLTVTDDDGGLDYAQSTITIDTVLNVSPVASFTESASTVLTGESILFNASGSSDPDGFIVSYFWDFGDGLNGSGVTVSHSYVDDGGFTVTLTVTDDDGAVDSVSALKTVLNRVPVASFTESATTAYVGEPISFNASASYDPDGYIVSYFWDFDDGFNATGVVVNHSYLSNGSFTVTLTVTDDDGGLDYAQSTITIDTVLNVSPVASFTESASTVLTGESILFNASGSSDPDGFIVSYFWDFGDGLNGSGVTVSHSYVDDGGFTVTLTVTDDDGAVDSVSALKTVLNRVPVASFTESATTAYVGEPISFNASASYDPDGYIVSYFWDFDDGFNATGVVVNHSYLSNGSFTVTLTVTDDDGGLDYAQSTITIDTVLNVSPVASFTESASTVLTGESILFNASGSSDPDGFIVSYFWDFGDGLNGSGVTVSHSYVDDGGFTVTLTVTDDDGAVDSVSALKTVLNRVPVASFTESATTAYVGEPISFNASASYDPDGYIVSYFWDFDDGFNATGVVVNHSYLSNGSFTVTLTVTDDDGGLDYAQSTIIIGSGVYDVAILNAITSATEVYKYHSINVSVLVDNEGTDAATFNVTLYAQRIHGWHAVMIDGRLAWYSDSKYSEDFLLQTAVDIPLNNPLLTFETKYDVEYLYDFGFVQLSVDGGITWVSLMNAFTTYDSMPDTSLDIVDNLPGFTGTSGNWPGWMTMMFNLSDYAGESVLLGFRYMTDMGSLGEGWFLDNVTINGIVIPDADFENFNTNPLIPLQTLTVENMFPGSQNMLMFQWNASEIIAAQYSLSAMADILVGETDTTDNVCFGGVVEVLMYPDIDGDGDVDIFDVVSVSGIYGCQEGEPGWNPRADLVEDGIINIFDVVAVASRYNEILELPKQMRLLGTRELGFRTT